jgi:hypothetical protein
MEEPGNRPGWSITWLFRIQHRQRTKPRPIPANGKGGTGFQWFSWIVLAFLIVEVGVLLYYELLPR